MNVEVFADADSVAWDLVQTFLAAKFSQAKLKTKMTSRFFMSMTRHSLLSASRPDLLVDLRFDQRDYSFDQRIAVAYGGNFTPARNGWPIGRQ